MGTIPGAVLGASVLFVLPEKLREFADYRLLLFGLALILIMRYRPQGLVPDAHRRAELAPDDDPSAAGSTTTRSTATNTTVETDR
jgi:branched-chain amino acid transport system permease protein